MLEAIGVKENSVRIRSGIFTIDVRVIQNADGTLSIKAPTESVYITPKDFRKLVAVALRAYNNSIHEKSNCHDKATPNN